MPTIRISGNTTPKLLSPLLVKSTIEDLTNDYHLTVTHTQGNGHDDFVVTGNQANITTAVTELEKSLSAGYTVIEI